MKEIHYISIKIGAFNSKQRECYCCQGFEDASEVCNFNLKCVMCSDKHLSTDCPFMARISPKSANCGLGHSDTFRGCIKNLYRLEGQKKNPTKYS